MTSLSIVIPCHDEPRRLALVLASLLAQLAPGDEVVVVDDHSRGPLFPSGRPPSVQLVRLSTAAGPGNRSAARNAGWQSTEGDPVVFLDGDMVPGPGFLENVRRWHRDDPSIVIKAARFALSAKEQDQGIPYCLGRVLRSELWAEAPPLRMAYEQGAWPPGDSKENPGAGTWWMAASNALSLRRSLVAEVGGWDEGYEGWGEEDMDFAYRLFLAGARFLFPKPTAHYAVHLDHPVDPSRRHSLRRNALRFVGKFPEIVPLRQLAYRQYGVRL